MRPSVHAHRLVIAAVLACSPAGDVSADETKLPMRKAGLWELKTVMDEGNGPRDQTLKICVGDEKERNAVAASLAEHRANCSKYEIKKAQGMTTAEGDCVFNGRQVISRTEMRGDFTSAFEVKIKSTTSAPEPKQQTIVVKREITQTGTYLGESCGELQAGEAMGPDGEKIAVQ